MRIEIELHEAQGEDGEPVRIRIIREVREQLDPEPSSITLVRDHDSGTELHPGASGEEYLDPSGRRYRLVRRLA